MLAPPVAGSVLIISRPNWESPSDVPVLSQATHRSTQRKRPRGRDDEEALTAAIIRLASQYGRYGYRRITALLRTEGWHVNDKRVQRIWRREGLKVPQKQPRGRLWLNDGSCIRLRPCWPDGSRLQPSYDFVMDRTHDGRKFRMLTVIRVYQAVHGRCRRAKIELGQCASTPLSDRALRPTWLAGSYPFRQRLRVYRSCRPRLARQDRVKTLYIEPGSPCGARITGTANGMIWPSKHRASTSKASIASRRHRRNPTP